ncbi:Trans-enoyl reductase FSL5 [Paramyrothecium foliicola]|nr:Trans-enoyl reductase FSL5 [Paramyrothecium foliicola]
MYHILLLVAAPAILWLLVGYSKQPPRLDMPYLDLEGDKSRQRYAAESVSLMSKGYEKFLKHGRPFMLRNIVDDEHPLVILPLKYLEEVKNASPTELSFALYVEKNSILKDIHGPTLTDEGAHMVRIDLNKCLHWVSMIPYPFLLQVFTHMSGRVLAGPELSQDDAWMGATLQYIGSFLKAVKSVRAKYKPSLRWLAKYVDADVKDVDKHRRQAIELLRPILEARLQARATATETESEDGLQWLIDAYLANGKRPKAEDITMDLLGMSVSSVHSSSATLLSTLYDLIDHPQAMEDIRREIDSTAKERGVWDHPALGSLYLLDSFMKESQRIHSVPEVTVSRMTAVPWTFQDGLHIPVGTQIGFPNRQLNLDKDTHEEPHRFDAKRFSRKRTGEDVNKFHFGSVAADSLNFGAGSQACPGRFLAQETIKLIFVHLLSNYDIKYTETGQQRPQDMPDNLLMDFGHDPAYSFVARVVENENSVLLEANSTKEMDLRLVLPETQTAIVANHEGELEVSARIPLPTLEPDMLLIKTVAVALNPVDVKMTGPMAFEGATAGGDVAGIVLAVGSKVKGGEFKVGDRVCAPIPSMNPLMPRIGAFAEYTCTIADCTLRIPDSMTFENAATLGVAVATIGYSLFHSLGIPGHPDKKAKEGQYVLVYGGSTAMGTMALQIIRRCGLTPITTCSPHNFALVESYGAAKVWDYHDPSSAENIRKYTENALDYALDCHCDGSSMRFCYAAIGRAGGRYTTLEPYNQNMHTRKRVKPDWLLGPALMGKEIPWKEPYHIQGDPGLRLFGRKWFAVAQRMLSKGEIRPHPIKILETVGLRGVLDGLDLLKKKTLSGEKVVCRIVEKTQLYE